MGRLEGKVAIISGAARGIGGAAARLFVREGAQVVLGDILAEEGSALAEELGESARFQLLDVTEPGSWEAAVAVAQTTFGPLTTLVNNAGVVALHSVADVVVEEYQRVIAVNQTGVLLGMQAAYRAMSPQGSGSIMNVSSTAAMSAYPGIISYVASKWAVRGMTKAAALEMASSGIRVNSIHPGQIQTALNTGSATAGIPLGWRGVPENIAWLMVYLASDESAFTTGTEHVVDGGETVILGTTAVQVRPSP
ncbi:MAG: SDR family oxidoreductase [Acidimicrobiales bacterium]|jgi:3alpha(or 20beta)-hydroxysteroid dehydrogenase